MARITAARIDKALQDQALQSAAALVADEVRANILTAGAAITQRYNAARSSLESTSTGFGEDVLKEYAEAEVAYNKLVESAETAAAAAARSLVEDFLRLRDAAEAAAEKEDEVDGDDPQPTLTGDDEGDA